MAIGDFEFTPDGMGTRYECVSASGRGQLPDLHHTVRVDGPDPPEPNWIEAQKHLWNLARDSARDPLV